ncbi:MAG: serine hydrolase [Caldilineaceae bacterium]|nr:serine hydrolase [Caldilineaceae bacterium]
MHETLLWQRLQNEVERAVSHFAGVAGIALLDLTSGRELAINADEIFPTASSIKIHILTQLLLRAQRGEIDLGARVTLEPDDIVLGSGVLAYLAGPVELTLLDVAILMIIVSDNSATNICLRMAGLEATNQMLDGLGLAQTRVRRKMMDRLAAVQEQENISTPTELVRLMALLRQGQPEANAAAKALEILRKPKRGILNVALPEGTIIANKPGYVEGTRCDVGIVELQRRPYIVAIMSKYALDGSYEHEQALVGMARLIHQTFVALEQSNRFGRYVYSAGE